MRHEHKGKILSTKQIHVFISHSWSYSGHYKTLADWIFERKWRAGQASLSLRDFSVPKDNPIHNARNDSQLKKAIFAQISRSHVTVIPTGMYANYSSWIQKEIDGSYAYGKPILAVNPWGAKRTSTHVTFAASKLVGWNAETVVAGIWELYKG